MNEEQLKQAETQPLPNLNNFKRDDLGLVTRADYPYVFNPDGTINWRKMIKKEFLVPHKQAFERRNKPVPESIDGLDDRDLLILLGGIKELAQLRGFTRVNYKVSAPSPDYVAAVCTIQWIKNYETCFEPVEFSAIGDAHPGNTNGFGRMFLGPIAENRSFIRCVRNFLKINIVSQEEVNGAPSDITSEDTSTNLLEGVMKKHGVTFEMIKNKLIQENFPDAASLTSISEVPKSKQFELLERIKRKAKENATS